MLKLYIKSTTQFLIIITFKLTYITFSFSSEQFNIFSIYCFLVGIPITMSSNNFRSNISFITLSIVTILFSSDIFSKLSEIQIVSRNIPLIETQEEIIQKNISVCTLHPDNSVLLYYIYYFQLNNSKIAQVFKESVSNHCDLKKFLKNENSIFIYASPALDFLLRQTVNSNKKFEILNLGLPYLLVYTIFGSSYPYKNKYSKIVNLLDESGFQSYWRKKKISRNKVNSLNEYSIHYILISITIIGSISGFILLMIEYFYYSLNQVKLFLSNV